MMEFFRKLKWFTERRRKEDELREELQFHIDEEAGEHQDQARARRELGNLTQLREETRSAWGWATLEQLAQDLRYAARTMLRNPAFAILAALSLALGIGANTAIYSFMDAVLMRSLPVADPGSLVVINWNILAKKGTDDLVIHDVEGQILGDAKHGFLSGNFPYPAFEQLRKSNDVLSVIFAYRRARKLNVMISNQAEVVDGEYVSGDYFRGLNVVPTAGRLIANDDDLAGAPGAVVLSYAFAENRFADVAHAIGQRVLINNIPFTAIGVAPPEFFGVDPAKAPNVYVPLHADLLIDRGFEPDRRYLDQNYYWTEMMGRLRPGVPIEQAQAAMAPVFSTWVAATATKEQERKNLPQLLLREGAGGLDSLRRQYSEPLFLLLTMSGLLLAIACANIANLLLARATARRREMAVRLSMGAGRWRIVRQLLAESLLLAALGGTAGILFAIWGIRLLTLMLNAGSGTFTLHADLNLRVLAAAFLLTMMTGVLFGLAPALKATRVDPMPVLKESRTGERTSRRWRFNLSWVLVAGQMAISVVLLVGAGLFVRTLSNLHSVDLGFQRENVLLFKLNARLAGHRDAEILPLYRDLEKRFASIPGVRSAAMANSPLIGDGAWAWPVVPVGKPKPEHAPTGHGSGMGDSYTRVMEADSGFFKTMQIPLLAGREFDERDRPGSAPVGIVNEAWARVNLEGRNPVGERVVNYGMDDKPYEMEIVGLVRNARYDDLTGNFPPVAYTPVEQDNFGALAEMTFFLRTAGDPLPFTNAVREIVRQADARIPVTALSTQTAQIEHEMTAQTLFARLCTVFAMLALVIACVGLYGTVSYNVARRTGEIGIRMALGAQRARVVRTILGQVLILASVGLLIGVPAAFGASKLVASLLYGLKPNDPLVMGAAVVILLGAAILAGYAPARRASRIDPMVALRHE
jgi:predicted permease